VIAITGGGTHAIGELLAVPGGSQSLIEAVVPYSEASLTDLLGSLPAQSCSEPTSRAMAMATWMRGRQLVPQADPHFLVGLGATASLASDRPKQGEHRIHVALQTSEQTLSLSLTLAKDARTRQQEEELAAMLVLIALAEACGVDCEAAENSLLPQLKSAEQVERQGQRAEPAWTDLLLGERNTVCCHALTSLEFEKPPAIFPGAFNPIHSGHVQMAEYAAQRLARDVIFEISTINVDKPPLDFLEISRRLDAIAKAVDSPREVLSAAPTFREKAKLFPGCTFVVGADTIARIADLRYYGGDPEKLESAIQQFADCECRFLVFGRRCPDTFRLLHELEIPSSLKALCDEVPEDEFHYDISSTELRSGTNNAD